MKNVFPECHALALGEDGLFPECHAEALGEIFLFFFSFFALFFGDALPHYLKLFAQVWFNFECFRLISFSQIFGDTSNLNYRCMKSYNLVFQKMIFMTFGVY
jgi:hypothetical protein